MGTLYRLQSRTKKKGFLGFTFAQPHVTAYVDASEDTHEAEEYVASATAEAMPHGTSIPEERRLQAPVNLPTGIGYQQLVTSLETEQSQALNDLENQAHAQKVLLSSDAMRYFVGQVRSTEEQIAVLQEVTKKARTSFPSEDGWVVLNLSRMETILSEVRGTGESSSAVFTAQTDLEHSISFTPMTAGSLAEAIVSGNTVAAYQLLAQRPMIALADATSDLDALYRGRKGETVAVSNFLKTEATKLSNEKLEAVIEALTSALDGRYSNEEEAVKMAIVKAIETVG